MTTSEKHWVSLATFAPSNWCTDSPFENNSHLNTHLFSKICISFQWAFKYHTLAIHFYLDIIISDSKINNIMKTKRWIWGFKTGVHKSIDEATATLLTFIYILYTEHTFRELLEEDAEIHSCRISLLSIKNNINVLIFNSKFVSNT